MRKLCRVLFSRYFISAVLILFELAFLGITLYYFYDYSWFVFAFLVCVNVFSVISLINRNANPEYKVSWLVVVLLVPFFGTALYLMFYSRGVSKKSAKLMKQVQDGLFIWEENSDGIPEVRDTEFFMLKAEDALSAGKAFAILNDDRLASVYRNTSSKFFGSGEEMYESMLSDLRRAEKYIFIEYFIIENTDMWQAIYRILKEKVAAGVEVRVIYDDIGCMQTLPAHYDRKLNSDGIKCIRFSPISPRIQAAHNNRDHRKILIVDGHVAYTGGINIADEYINKTERFGHWKDGGIRIFGDAVKGFLKLFLSAWNFTLGKPSHTDKYFLQDLAGENGDGGYYIPFGSGPAPIYPRPVGKNAILNIINQSEKYVYITTPYLIIDYDLTESLCNAAMRGVDVRIITPGKADKKLVKVMTKSAYPYLIKSGVKIYEYAPGFIHEKTVVSDDRFAIIGTINLDYRSLVHHFEDAVWIYNSPTVFDIKEEFLNTLSLSDEKDEREAKLSFPEWCVRNLIRIFAPLL